MNPSEKLIKIFSEFPGIGPKQARRFVYFLINKNQASINEFTDAVKELKVDIDLCKECRRYFSRNTSARTNDHICSICSDESRDNSVLMVVGRDIDLDNIEKVHIFRGRYFVLGGLIPILDKNPEQKVRTKELTTLVTRLAEHGLKEIILGLDANAEGEYTSGFVASSLLPLSEKYNIKISELGRGLSTGTELEYSDPETIKNALQNRK